ADGVAAGRGAGGGRVWVVGGNDGARLRGVVGHLRASVGGRYGARALPPEVTTAARTCRAKSTTGREIRHGPLATRRAAATGVQHPGSRRPSLSPFPEVTRGDPG